MPKKRRPAPAPVPVEPTSPVGPAPYVAHDPCTDPDAGKYWGVGPSGIPEGSGAILNHRGDYREFVCAAGLDRCEVGRLSVMRDGVITTTPTFYVYRPGEHRITRFRLRLPDASIHASSSWVMFMQQKQAQTHPDGGGNPILSLHCYQGEWKLWMTDGTTAAGTNRRVWGTPVRTAGDWVEGSLDVDYGSPGRIRFQIDGGDSGHIVRPTLKTASDGKLIPSVCRMGIYRSVQPYEARLHLAEVSVS